MAENKEKRENSRIISSDDPDALEKLRKKLEEVGIVDMIRTRKGIGYTLD